MIMVGALLLLVGGAAVATGAVQPRGFCVRNQTGEIRNLWLNPLTGKCPDPFWGPVAMGSGAQGPAGPKGDKGDPGDGATAYVKVVHAVNASAAPAPVVVVQPKGSILIACGVSPHGVAPGAASVALPAACTGAGDVRLAANPEVATAATDRSFTVSGGTAADSVTLWLLVSSPPA
jgi:hypothetical protein